MNNNDQIVISVAKDFSEYPGARYRTDGDFSGQQFYEEILKPKLEQVWGVESKTVLLDLDGTFGYASSFISEVFIRTVKDFKDKDKILTKVSLKCDDEPLLIQTIVDIIRQSKLE